MQGGGLISEGGFGCIYHPSLTKTGKESDSKYVSKLQVENFASANETEIGKQITKIWNYQSYFVPVISSQKVEIGKFDNKMKKVCGAYNRHPKRKFTISKLHYLEGYTLNDYIINELENRKLFIYIIDCFKHLIVGIKKLNTTKIVHFDLKGENIIFNNEKNIPMIIDFGLSIPMQSVKKNLKDYFYTYAPSYYYWPIEVHFLNYIIHVNKSPTEHDVKKISKEYVYGNTILQTNFTNEFINQYEKLCITVLKKLLPLNYKQKIDKVLEMANTWDNYSLCLIYLRYLYYFNVKGYVKNNFNIFFSKLLTQNIHPNAAQRYNIEETKQTFEGFWFNEGFHNAKNFTEILANINKTALEMKYVIIENVKKERNLKRKK